MALKTKAHITKNPKQGYQLPNKKNFKNNFDKNAFQ